MHRDVVTFLYHEVSNNPNTTGFLRKSNLPYKHKEEEFLKNIEAIKEAQIIPTRISDINIESENHKIMLTFDDGGKSAMYIADVLEKNNWYGHFFITTSMIGKNTFLNKHNINELFKRGHIIGSHSHSHPTPFNKLTIVEMVEEWSTSKNILEQILSSEISCGSVPGGDMDNKTILSANQSNIKYLFTSEPTNKIWKKNETFLIGRVCPKAGTKISKIKKFANNEGFAKERLFRKVKNLIRILLGPLYPYYVKIRHSS